MSKLCKWLQWEFEWEALYSALLGAKCHYQVYTFDSDNQIRLNHLIWVDLKWSNFSFSDSGKMQVQFGKRWFCSVGSPCIIEATHWSHPSHIVEKWLFCFGKFWLEPSLLAKLSWNFFCHLAATVPMLETNNISLVCPYNIKIRPVMKVCNWKLCSAFNSGLCSACDATIFCFMAFFHLIFFAYLSRKLKVTQ